MNMTDASWIEHDEGRRLQAYDDADDVPLKSGLTLKGHPTVGVGHNLEVPMCAEAVEAQFQHDLEILARQPLMRVFPGHPVFNDAPRLAALTNMMFNLGESTFREFGTFVKLVDAEDWERAATDLRNTKVYEELPARYERIARCLEIGQWPNLPS